MSILFKIKKFCVVQGALITRAGLIDAGVTPQAILKRLIHENKATPQIKIKTTNQLM